MTTSIAFVFPGQGSQSVGMGKALHDAIPVAAQVFAEASEALDLDIAALCFEGPQETLTQTANAQPALLTCSVAALRAVEARGVAPTLVAGHSLGEFSALVAAGSIDLAEAVRLVRRRGELMEEAGRRSPGGMAAVLGLPAEQVEALCEQARAESGAVVQAANFNCPGQVVISGAPEGLQGASLLAKQAGAKRVAPLQVSGAFHSELMAAARAGLAEALGAVGLRDAKVPVVQNVSAQAVTGAEEIRAGLLNQLTSSVRWEQSVRAMAAAGVSTFIEVGPGRVLSGLIRRILPEARTLYVEDPDSLDATLAELA
jgi:[acyl-carrier-protein] S-malonyltransferase